MQPERHSQECRRQERCSEVHRRPIEMDHRERNSPVRHACE